MERSELRRQISVGVGLLALGVLVLWQVAGQAWSAARAETAVTVPAQQAAGPKLEASELKVLGAIYSAIIKEKPVATPQGISGLAREEPAAVRRTLKALAQKGLVALDPSGNVLFAPPFSVQPTRHAIWLPDGRRVYACSAWDALAIPAVLGCDALLRSETPQFGRIVNVNFSSGRIASVSPLGALLWIPRGTFGLADECQNTSLFTSPPELNLWQGEHTAAAHGLSPALTQAKRTATERLVGRVHAALEAVGERPGV